MKKLFLISLISLFTAHNAYAWQTQLEDNEYLPPSLVIVSKEENRLAYLEKHSPLSVRYEYPSIHGKAEGDKNVEGDLKTPEGVYFITTRIKYEIDFDVYGSQAYALNYPNPVDRLRGKTGFGIWIHSKGKPIAGQTTEGCVAIDLDNIDELGPHLKPLTAVVLAQKVENPITKKADLEEASGSNIDTSQLQASLSLNSTPETLTDAPQNVSAVEPKLHKKLAQLTVEWNQAWADRSNNFFKLYNTSAYSRAQGEAFNDFRNQKKSLFNRLNWIYIDHDKIQVLEGPGYYVTWFNQYYRAPNHSTQGIRRLYWQKDNDGEFKVVGMEWLPRDLGMQNRFEEHAKKSVPSFLEAWKSAWLTANTEDYSIFYKQDAKQDSLKGLNDIVEKKQAIWQTKKPTQIDFSNISIEIARDAVYVSMKQNYKDSSGYKDYGTKKMKLFPQGSSWVIAEENWYRK